ncbi:MAG TPA: PA0069 family radical SAM protein [Alphaproteobacteria bacterium]|nr:PA0069 family radical SAM protein [Alphaproteobacteria bacterium]
MDEPLPDRPAKGRGAVSNRSGRFEAQRRERTDDGWAQPAALQDPDDEAPPLRTTLTVDTSRSIITRNDSPDIPFTQSVNPYRGCEHGCVYCFARPSHAYLGLSPGLDFETRLFYKPAAPELLDAELRRPGHEVSPIALGANTDPYQPVERELGLTRRIVEVLAAFRHPFAIVTKSATVLRDLDLLAPLARQRLVGVCVSVTTLDRDLARRLEPRAAAPARRLETIRRLSEAGVPVTVLASPMIPGLNDHELESILAASRDAGAVGAAYILLRLPLEIGGLFEEWLRAHAPDRAERVLSLIRQCRDGALYQTGFGRRMTGSGPYADLLRQRFRLARARLGLEPREYRYDTGLFRPPPRPGDQLSLL